MERNLHQLAVTELIVFQGARWCSEALQGARREILEGETWLPGLMMAPVPAKSCYMAIGPERCHTVFTSGRLGMSGQVSMINALCQCSEIMLHGLFHCQAIPEL